MTRSIVARYVAYRKCAKAEYKKAMYRPTARTTEKCIACFPRLEGKDKEVSPTGAPAETRCMSARVGKIRLPGLVKTEEGGAWAKDPQNPLYYLIRERQIALPLYSQFGTEPNGFYVPPRWVPRGYPRFRTPTTNRTGQAHRTLPASTLYPGLYPGLYLLPTFVGMR